MGKRIDQQLLGFRAEEETLEQSCRIRIGRAAEDAGGNDDQREPSVAYTTSTGLPWSLASTRL